LHTFRRSWSSRRTLKAAGRQVGVFREGALGTHRPERSALTDRSARHSPTGSGGSAPTLILTIVKLSRACGLSVMKGTLPQLASRRTPAVFMRRHGLRNSGDTRPLSPNPRERQAVNTDQRRSVCGATMTPAECGKCGTTKQAQYTPAWRLKRERKHEGHGTHGQVTFWNRGRPSDASPCVRMRP
jgi:hypothetical protein